VDKVEWLEMPKGLTKRSLKSQLYAKSFIKNVRVPGTDKGFNQELEKATRKLLS
jgi:succinate dehydrogenase / fumarate reductase flavoprotein subunit